MNDILKRCLAALLALCLILGSAWRVAPEAKAEDHIENADTNEEIKQPADDTSQEMTTDDELNALLEFYAFLKALPEKALNVIFNAIKTALNTATLKKLAPAAAGNADAFVMELWKKTDHFNASATAIKKAATALIKSGEYPHDDHDDHDRNDKIINVINITKAAGGKYNIALNEVDTTKINNIPKAAVEKPTLHTDPAVNESTGMPDHGEDGTTDWGGTATCTERAICQICGAPYGKINPDNHDWGEWAITAAPSCTNPGTETRVCNRDDSHTETRTTDALGHQSEEVAAVPPTCTKTGLTEGEVCSVCGETLNGREVIPALGHAWGEWKDVETLNGKTLQRRVCARNLAHTEERYVDAFIPSPVTAPVTSGQ